MRIAAPSAHTIARFLVLFFVLLSPFAVSGGQAEGTPSDAAAAANGSQPCHTAGQIFGTSGAARTVMLKSDAGDLIDVVYDDSTVFLRISPGSRQLADAQRLPPEELGVGDRFCVQGLQPGRQMTASRVLVTFRADIDAMEKAELTNWQADSAFGVVTALDPKTRRITLAVSEPGTPTNLTVDAGGDVIYRIFPTGSSHLGSAVPGAWGKISTGEAIYVHGHKKAASGPVVAGLIIGGEVRSFAGTIESIDALNELVRLHDLQSGKTRAVHVGPSDLYVAGRRRSGGGNRDRTLYNMSFGDLEPGDSVLVLGRQDRQSDQVTALALIAGFAPSGLFPSGTDERVHPVLDALGLGAKE